MLKELKSANAPAAIGPYCQGIEAQGTVIYVSGQLPIDPATGEFPGDSIQIQTKQSLENIKAILAEAGCTMANVVNIYGAAEGYRGFRSHERSIWPIFPGTVPGSRSLPGRCSAQECPRRNRSCCRKIRKKGCEEIRTPSFASISWLLSDNDQRITTAEKNV